MPDAPQDLALPPLTVRNSGYVRLKRVDDNPDGTLCIMEAERDVPFPIRRIYYINQLENCISHRGEHAHKTLWQCIFCINGSFSLMLDDGTHKQDVRMWQAHVGVILGPGLWHTMHSFSSGCVLLVAASDYYAAADYMRDYGEFQTWAAAHPEPLKPPCPAAGA